MKAPNPLRNRVLAAAILLLMAWPTAAAAAEGGATAGKTLYEKHCSACHGKTGKGIGTLPNLSDARYMAGRTDAQLLEKIAKGGQGSGMPAWEKILSEQQRHDLLAYIRTLAK
jgi:cbb3-type cytochrome c oxidase subunit III